MRGQALRKKLTMSGDRSIRQEDGPMPDQFPQENINSMFAFVGFNQNLLWNLCNKETGST